MRAPAHREVSVRGVEGDRLVEKSQVARAMKQRVVALVLAKPGMRGALGEDQRLDRELEVDDAAFDLLQLLRLGAVLRAHLAAHRLDLLEEPGAIAGRGEDRVAYRLAILATPRDRARLFEEIQAMRRKMRAENRSEAQELKQIEGGIIDLEFAVQALVLAEGPAHPGLRENKGNHTLLHRAGELALIDPAIAAGAASAYLAMRRRTHEAALNDEEKVKLAPGELASEREAVKRLWKTVFAA